MHLPLLLLAFALFALTSPAAAEEAATSAEQPAAAVQEEVAPAESQAVTDAVGLGRTGYGSPVLSDRVAIGEIYGGRSGYVHPFLSVGGFHTDNLFRTPDDEKSDWVTVITPGVWFSLPASQQKLLEVNLLNTAPGGLAVSRFRTEAERRLQGYALYRADIREHDRYTEENRIDHHAEGLLRISLRGGLSLELVDVYEVNRDPYGTGGSRQLDKYSANLFGASLSYRLSPKLTLRGDYGNYLLDYDEARNDHRDRTDNSWAAYAYYQATPKTALFLQFAHDAIDYDADVNDDSDNLAYFLGVEYKVSIKTRAMLKIGYGEKSYDRNSAHDREDLLAEAQIDYAFTPKTSIYLKGLRRVLETDQSGAFNILSTRAQVGYRQRILAKLRAEAAAFYTNNEYDGIITIGTVSSERDDDEYGAILALGYAPVPWATMTVGYEYRERDSNFDTEDYKANTFFVRLTAAM